MEQFYDKQREGGTRWGEPFTMLLVDVEYMQRSAFIRLYGRCGAASVAVDVRGFRPHAYLRGMTAGAASAFAHNLLDDDETAGPSSRRRRRSSPVTRVDDVMAYPAFPYTPTPEPFARLEFESGAGTSPPFAIRRLVESLPSGVEAYNILDPVDEFLATVGLVGFGWVRVGACSPSDCEEDVPTTDVAVTAEMCDIAAYADEGLPPLRVMSVDIECVADHGFPAAERDPIIIIAATCSGVPAWGGKKRRAVIQLGGASRISDDQGGDAAALPPLQVCTRTDDTAAGERALLGSFATLLRAFDPDVLVGHNIAGFDLPYIVERAHQLGVAECECLGRRGMDRFRTPRAVERRRKNGETTTTKIVDVPGRVVLDTYAFIKGDVTRRERSYKLGSLARKYLGCDKDDVGYKMIGPLWRGTDAQRARLGRYCMHDADLALRLAEHEDMLFRTVEMSRVTGVPATRLLRSGQQEKVWSLLLRHALHPGWARNGEEDHPVLMPHEHGAERAADDKFEGACVLEPCVGFYAADTPIAVGDFSSLYPSIMITHNICFTTELIGETEVAYIPVDVSPTGTRFVKPAVRRGLVPQLLEHLLQSRGRARAAMAAAKTPEEKGLANARQLALKVVCNSVYGFTTASGGRLARMELGESVTAWGRDMLGQASEVARGDPHRAAVIYGDTDSVMIERGRQSVAGAFGMLRQVCAAVTARFSKPVQLEAEKVYAPFLLLTKKRYAGLKYMRPDDPKPAIDYKGLELARRDSCEWVASVLSGVLERLLLPPCDPGAAVEFVKGQCRDLTHGRVPVDKLILSRAYARTDYKSRMPHVELAKRLAARDPSLAPTLGDRIPFLIVCSQDKDALVCDRAEDPLWAMEHGMPLDMRFYIMQQLAPAVSRLLSPVLCIKKPAVIQRVFGTLSLSDHAPRPAFGIARAFVRMRKCELCGKETAYDMCEDCANTPEAADVNDRKVADVEEIGGSWRGGRGGAGHAGARAHQARARSATVPSSMPSRRRGAS